MPSELYKPDSIQSMEASTEFVQNTQRGLVAVISVFAALPKFQSEQWTLIDDFDIIYAYAIAIEVHQLSCSHCIFLY